MQAKHNGLLGESTTHLQSKEQGGQNTKVVNGAPMDTTSRGKGVSEKEQSLLVARLRHGPKAADGASQSSGMALSPSESSVSLSTAQGMTGNSDRLASGILPLSGKIAAPPSISSRKEPDNIELLPLRQKSSPKTGPASLQAWGEASLGVTRGHERIESGEDAEQRRELRMGSKGSGRIEGDEIVSARAFA